MNDFHFFFFFTNFVKIAHGNGHAFKYGRGGAHLQYYLILFALIIRYSNVSSKEAAVPLARNNHPMPRAPYKLYVYVRTVPLRALRRIDSFRRSRAGEAVWGPLVRVVVVRRGGSCAASVSCPRRRRRIFIYYNCPQSREQMAAAGIRASRGGRAAAAAAGGRAGTTTRSGHGRGGVRYNNPGLTSFRARARLSGG